MNNGSSTTIPNSTTSETTRVFGQLPPPGDVQDGRQYGLNEVRNNAKVEMFNKINAQLSAAHNGNAADNGKPKYNGGGVGDVAVIDIVDGGECHQRG